MIVGLYTSVTGKVARSINQDIISRNLANVNTVGFKMNRPSFSTFMNEDKSIHGVALTKMVIDHKQGSIKETGNKLDLAIHGNGYFTMETPDGLRYSRNGHFLLNSENNLINDMGWKLAGEGGPIILPQNVKNVLIGENGRVSADGVVAGTLKIVDFKNKDDLKEVGSSSFMSKSDSPGGRAEEFAVQQGYLENSNVNVIDEMVSLMANMRSFEGNNKVTKSIDRTLEKLIRTAYTVI